MAVQKKTAYLLTRRRGFSLACLTGAFGLAPVLRWGIGETNPAAANVPGWLDQLEGRPLKRGKLADREKPFAVGFPGAAAAFDEGRRRVLLRYTERPTRHLRPARQCLAEEDYAIRPLPDWTDSNGAAWSSFQASKTWERWLVRERVFDHAGESWPTVDDWFWPALLGSTRGPWWSVVTMEPLSR